MPVAHEIEALTQRRDRSGKRVKVLDCFTFFDELDHLRLRMAELSGVVDAFVLVEATHSHSGQLKPLYSERLPADALPPPATLIRHVADLSGFDGPDRWAREHAQRDALLEALQPLGCDPDDVILLSDADEIPRASAIPAVVEMVRRRHVAILEQRLYRFYLNNVTVAKDNLCGWSGPVAVRYADLLRATPSSYRNAWCGGGQLSRYASPRQRRVTVANAGWHFTYMGGARAVAYKRQHFAHTEGDDPTRARVPHDAASAEAGERWWEACHVYGQACVCGCTWQDLPQAYAAPSDGFSLADMDLPASMQRSGAAFAHWVRAPRTEPQFHGINDGDEVDVLVVRDRDDVAWLLTPAAARMLPGKLHVVDIRPGRHQRPDAHAAAEWSWIFFPSATPGRALNAFLARSGVETMRRWFPGARGPLPVLSRAEWRDAGGYDERLPAGEEWDLRLRLAERRGTPASWRRMRSFLQPAPRGSALWEAQLYATSVRPRTTSFSRPLPLSAAMEWRARIWRARERVALRQARAAWRTLVGRG